MLHGDGGAFQRADSIIVLSMRSILSSAPVAHSQMLLVALPKSAVHKSDNPAEDTMHCLWAVLTWSLSHMFFGKFPERNHLEQEWRPKSSRAKLAGQKLNNGGKAGIVFALSADGEFFQNEYKLQGFAHSQCCWSCGCNKSDIPHNDYRACAKWRGTIKNHKKTSPTDHLVMTVPGINGYSFAYDSLHILDLGVSSHICANIMFDLVMKEELPGSTQEARLKELLKRVTNLYEELGTDSSNQLRRINFSTFCNPKAKHDSFPDLTGVKARIVRYLIPVMLELCQTFVDETLYKKHRLQCITCLETMYQCMENQHLHPTEKAYKDFKENMEKCLLHYSRLAKISIQQHRLQWNTVHKHHLACHMPDQFRYLNCRFVSTYSGETMVGFMASLGHSCLNGTPPHLVPTKVAWRFRLGMHLRLSHNCELMDSEEEF